MSRTSMSATDRVSRSSRAKPPFRDSPYDNDSDNATMTIARGTVPILATALSLTLLSVAIGCGAGPRHFRAIENPSAVFRARAASLGEKLPDRKVIPKLIEHLEDEDPMVRLTANQELRRRTGQDFRFVPWGDPEERARSAAQWRAWWSAERQNVEQEQGRRRP